MTKTTRRAFLSSVVALVICLTMLIGTTFAWFTDTASTAVNTIHSGTLDVELGSYINDEWVSLEGEILSWQKAAEHGNEEVLWEPGCTYELQDVVIRNNGNLALKYVVAISGVNGDAKLNEAIEWTIKVDNENYLSTEGHLLPHAEATLTISGHMKEDAGNEYQGLSIEGAAITVYATQYTHEFDSTTDQYDKDATLPSVWDGTTEAPAHVEGTTEYHIENAAQFATFFGGEYSIPAGSTVYLDCDVDLGGRTIKGYNNGTFDSDFDGQGHTVSNFTVTTTFHDGEHYCGLFPNVYGGHSVKNLTVKNASAIAPNGVGMVGLITGAAYENTTIDNCHVINCTVVGEKKVAAVVGYTNGTVSNCSATDCAVYCAVSADEVSGGRDHQAGKVIGYIDGGASVADNTFDNVTVAFNAKPVSTADELATALDNTGNAPSYDRIVVLTDDIDGSDWTAIPGGSNYPAVEIYGNGHAIKNLTQPLFQELPACKYVFDSINFTNVNIDSTKFAATLVGQWDNNGGGSMAISNCTINGGSIATTSDYAAGFVAFTAQIAGTLNFENCTINNVDISAAGSCGGFTGHTYAPTTIANCEFSDGSVTCTENRAGSDAKAGALVGTVCVSTLTVSETEVNGVDVNNTGATPINDGWVGRTAHGGTVTIVD